MDQKEIIDRTKLALVLLIALFGAHILILGFWPQHQGVKWVVGCMACFALGYWVAHIQILNRFQNKDNGSSTTANKD